MTRPLWPWLLAGGVGALLHTAAGLDHPAALGLAGLLVGGIVIVARRARA